MNNENNVVTKTSKGVIIAIILLVIMVIGLMGYILYDKVDLENNTNKEKIESKTNQDNLKSSNDIEEDENDDEDEEEILKEITKIYERAYNTINSHEAYIDYNKEELSPYFTQKALSKIEVDVTNSQASGIPAFFNGIFGKTNQGIRTLYIVDYEDDIVVATGQLKNSQNIDSDNYPLYIIFKKDSGTFKIDLFE